jgi:transketolase
MLSSLQDTRQQCADRLLDLHKRANSGHIGSSLSCLEILVDLCFGRMTGDDMLVMSKGHAASALYTTLSLSGRLPEANLGHGLGLASGLAFAQRFTGKSFKVFTVLSDGDCNEGSTWEAALFAAHHKLSQLTVILDLNGLQGIGPSKDILNLEPVVDKWRAFGFAVAVAENGNDFASLARAHAELAGATGPRCVLARTTKGHGVSYMANKMEWHYLPMSDAQFADAKKQNPLL